jgi:hypothetical protein
LIFGVTLAVIWLATGAIDKEQTKNANVSPTASKTNDQSQFAREALKFGGEGVGAGMFKDNLDAGGKAIDSFEATQAFGITFNEKGELFVAARPFVVKYEIKN